MIPSPWGGGGELMVPQHFQISPLVVQIRTLGGGNHNVFCLAVYISLFFF